jgi:excisionase family DNA binding protein
MRETITSFDQLPAMLTARHLVTVFGLSKGKVYALLHSELPAMRFGKRLLVSKAHLLEYLEENKRSNKKYEQEG